MQSETSPTPGIAPTSGIHVAPRPQARPETTEEILAETRPENNSAIWPRITLVTPVYNGIRYIEETIRSIVYQGYPTLNTLSSSTAALPRERSTSFANIKNIFPSG